MRVEFTVMLLVVLIMCVIQPAEAVKVYLNPSDQIHNWSPDKTYCEAEGMQDVAKRLAAKLSARGFEVKNSDGKTMADSCNEANEWPADLFISLHSNARGGSGWGAPHGTLTLYFQPRDQSPPNPISMELAKRCADKCAEKFTTHGRGRVFGVVADLPFLTYNLYVLRKTNMPGTLVEGLFHDNLEDTECLKSDEGRDAYAQGVYEALCDYVGWSYYPDSPVLDPMGPVANSADGRLEIAATGKDGRVFLCRQTGINGAWATAWDDLKGSQSGPLAVGRSAQGRLEVFCRDSGGRIRHKLQSSADSTRWNGWYDLGGRMASDPVVGTNADGRLSVFAIGADKRVWHKVQRSAVSSLTWDGWLDLGKPDAVSLTVCGNADGRLMLIARDSSGKLQYKIQQAPNSPTYGDWLKLDGPVSGDPVAIRNADGRIAVFALDPNSAVRYRLQKAPNSSAWDDWHQVGVGMAGTPSVSISTDGRLEVFARNSAGEVRHYSQKSPGGSEWADGKSLGGSAVAGPFVARNKDGRITVFAKDSEGRMKYRVQREPSKSAIWDGWYTLGGDDAKF